MKKLIITAFAAALFTVGAMAQDSTSVNNNYQQSDSARSEILDRTGNNVPEETPQPNPNVERGVEQTTDQVQQTDVQLRKDTEQTGDSIQSDVQDAGNNLQQDAEQAGETMKEGADRASDNLQQGAQQVGDSLQSATGTSGQMDNSSSGNDSNSSDMNQSDSNNMNANGMNNASAAATPSPIEVLPDKEGPQNQVVYKYQGELFYVDRDEQKLVKVQESELKDASHEAIVHEGGSANEDSQQGKMKKSHRE